MLTSNLLQQSPCLYGRGNLSTQLFQLISATLFVTALVLICQINFDLLVFDKSAIERGEYWRLVSGHFTHSSFTHAVWDVLAFSASLVWLGMYSTRAVLPAVLAGILTVDALLLSSGYSLGYYCGLSGILFSPLIVAAFLHGRHSKNVAGFVPLLIIIIKLMNDLISQDTVFVSTTWQAYPESHLAGAIGGLLVLGVCTLKLENMVKTTT